MLSRLLCLALLGCGSATSLPVDAHCNPLGAGACLAPWPSSAFELEDPSTVTGRRVALPDDAIPRGVRDEDVDPSAWNALDGFSAATPIIAEFPGGVSSVGLPAADNMDPSLALDSPTVILDLTTGGRVAHWAELGDDDTVLILHPAARLHAGHRYGVAITSRVQAADGGELPSPPGFRALLAGRRTDHPLLEAMRGRADEVLDALDEAGVTDELVLAWDFTVASELAQQAELVGARDRALATLAAHPSLFKITEQATHGTLRLITGTLDAPLVLSNGGEPRANTRLVHDEGGVPSIQGLYRIPFAAVIPSCAGRRPAVVIWGHAPFGDAMETLGTDARQLATAMCAIVVGTELRGRAASDVAAVERAIADLGNAGELDIVVQGVLDHLTMIRALPALFGEPSAIYYAGPSPAIAALPELTRAAIVEPVEPARFAAQLARTYAPIEAALVRGLVEARWDRVHPARRARPVLVQAHVGEPAAYLARTFELPLIDPGSTPWGVRTQHASDRPVTGVVQDLGLTTLREFFTTGRITPAPM